MRLMVLVATLVVVLVGAAQGLGAQGLGAQTPAVFPPDTVLVGLPDTDTPTIDAALELSRATFEDGGSDVVLVGRSDIFADSLSAGVGQADGPLLLVDSQAALDPDVAAEISRLGAGRATILGGTSAVSEGVEAELAGLGLSVTRLSGANRVQTAVSVAQALAPDADTAILARANGLPGDPSSSFADALTAGGWAARNRWPVLLTQTDGLSDATADYLTSSAVRTVRVMGGTAAISDLVVQDLRGLGLDVDRIAGADRAATAVAAARAQAAGDAVLRGNVAAGAVILADGYGADAWAAGFAAAAHAARNDAPIVLANAGLSSPGALPPATREWLVPGPDRLTCAVPAAVCERARLAIGFEPALLPALPRHSVTFTATDGATSGVYAAAPDGTALGMVYRCASAACTDVDWSAGGESLAVLEAGTGVLELSGTDLELHDRFFVDDDVVVIGMAAGEDAAVPHLGAAFTVADGRPRIATRSMVGAQLAPGQAAEDDEPLALLSFQVFNRHPDYLPQVGAMLYAASGNRLMVKGQRADGGNESVAAHLQPRAGATLLGAAWSPAGSGDIALVDSVGDIGLLRYAVFPDGQPTAVAGLDITGPPYWTTDGTRILVMARGTGSVNLVAVDVAAGTSRVLQETTGASPGARIDADPSGTVIAWRAGDSIRVLDTVAGSVATIVAPPGFTVSGGPSLRP